jgi:hypothetical protein
VATITVKTYRCDVCGDKVAGPKDLRKFFIEWGAKPVYGRGDRPGIRIELCREKCVERFATALLPFIDDKGYQAIVPVSPKEGENDDDNG